MLSSIFLYLIQSYHTAQAHTHTPNYSGEHQIATKASSAIPETNHISKSQSTDHAHPVPASNAKPRTNNLRPLTTPSHRPPRTSSHKSRTGTSPSPSSTFASTNRHRGYRSFRADRFRRYGYIYQRRYAETETDGFFSSAGYWGDGWAEGWVWRDRYDGVADALWESRAFSDWL